MMLLISPLISSFHIERSPRRRTPTSPSPPATFCLLIPDFFFLSVAVQEGGPRPGGHRQRHRHRRRADDCRQGVRGASTAAT